MAVPGAALAAPQPASAVGAVVAPVFGTTNNLGASGGEPSMQDDGAGNIYITSPQGAGSMGTGVRFSHSSTGGQSFIEFTPGKKFKDIGGTIGGGDSDVVVDSGPQKPLRHRPRGGGGVRPPQSGQRRHRRTTASG